MMQIPNDIYFSWVESEIIQGHSVQISLKGTSMYPLLREGKDKVILSSCPQNELREMDVVLFKYAGTHILHRIIDRNGNILTIQGDGSYTTVERCSVFDVIGRVESIVRPTGKIISASSWKWRLPSYMWVYIGRLRIPILRFLHFYKRMTNR